MRNLKQLWQQRLADHIKEIAKYSRYIFNDHLTMILVILLAFAAIYYHDLLQTLQAQPVASIRLPIVLLATALLTLASMLGRPLWLSEAPDRSYLFPLGDEWRPHWLLGSLLSALLPMLFISLLVYLLYPLLQLAELWSGPVWLLAVLICLYKIASHLQSYLNIFGIGPKYQGQALTRSQHGLVLALILLVAFSIGHTWSQWILLGAVLLCYLYLAWGLSQSRQSRINFHYVIDQEEERRASLYRSLAVFADVPKQEPTFKRRAWLDGLLDSLDYLNRNRYAYLYIRVILRNEAYAKVWLRVMVFVAVLLVITDRLWLAAGLGVLGHIMTLVQLVPLIHHYDRMPFQQLYPNRADSAVASFQQIMRLILLLQSLSYSLVYSLTTTWSIYQLALYATWLVLAVILVSIYVPYWEKNYQKKMAGRFSK